MSDIKLFKLGKDIIQLEGKSVVLEKSLQTLIENHLEAFLGVRFLASEYSTGKTHKGRIDTLGIDENGCPVIIEYKRSTNENVINQGLFYLDWLLDHQAEFELLVLKRYGEEVSANIEWSEPRLLCIAGDFTRYDEHAVQQMNHNIELIRYRKFGDDLLLFELVNATSATEQVANSANNKKKSKNNYKTVSEFLEQIEGDYLDRYKSLEAFILSLGDDVQIKTLKYYIAFKRIKNFACVEIRPKGNVILLYLKADIDRIDLEEGFTRDLSNIGHFGTGDLEVKITSDNDLEKAKPLIIQSYENS